MQHSPPPRSDPSRDALRQLQTLQGLPTDRLLNINVRLDAKKSAHVPGFYGNPRTERARSAAAAAAIAPTTLTHERLNVDRDRVMANMVQRLVSIARQAIEILGDDGDVPLLNSMIGSRSAFRECQAIGCTVHGVPGAREAIQPFDWRRHLDLPGLGYALPCVSGGTRLLRHGRQWHPLQLAEGRGAGGSGVADVGVQSHNTV